MLSLVTSVDIDDTIRFVAVHLGLNYMTVCKSTHLKAPVFQYEKGLIQNQTERMIVDDFFFLEQSLVYETLCKLTN